MKPDVEAELEPVVDAFLAFLFAPGPLRRAEWPQLAEHLHRLGQLATRAIARSQEPPEADAPGLSYEDLREKVVRRCPDFGLYNQVPVLTDAGELDMEQTPLVGDAIDDLTDIARDLETARWSRRNGSSGDELRAFAHSFRIHWGRHLCDLLSYLHHRTFEE